MRVTANGDGDLVVTHMELFIVLLLAAFVLVAVGVWLAPIPSPRAVGWDIISGLFAVALFSAAERSRFVFDRAARQLRWRRTTPLRRVAGVVPFAGITGLSLERDFARSGQRGSAVRLVLHTSDGPLPLTSAFTGIGRAAERTGDAIQRYLSAADPPREVPFVKA